MKLTNKIITTSILSLFALYSCSFEQLNQNTIQKNNISKNQSSIIKGVAEFDDIQQLKENFKIKADTSITTRATVSLMYASDYNNVSLRNTTIATGLSDLQGNFSINTNSNFIPEINRVLVLEAKKRIGGAGNTNLSLRTNILWNGSNWQSITSSGIKINKKTTALSIIASLDPNTLTPYESINKLVYQNNVGHVMFNSKLTVSRFNAVYKEVENLLFNFKDPVEGIIYLSPFTGAVNSGYIYYQYNSLKSNMHSFQTIVETYAVDWGGIYAENIEALEQEARNKTYWNDLQNPFSFFLPHGGISESLPSIINFYDYQNIQTTALNYNGYVINNRSSLRGAILYKPIINNSYITTYAIYGVNVNGELLKNNENESTYQTFVLTNY